MPLTGVMTGSVASRRIRTGALVLPGRSHFGGTVKRVIGTLLAMVHALRGTTDILNLTGRL